MIELEVLKKILNSYLSKPLTIKSRKRDFVNARYVFSAIAYKMITKNKSEIARSIKRNHATVLSYLEKFSGVHKSDKAVRVLYDNVLRDFKESQPHILTMKVNVVDSQINGITAILNKLRKKRLNIIENG